MSLWNEQHRAVVVSALLLAAVGLAAAVADAEAQETGSSFGGGSWGSSSGGSGSSSGSSSGRSWGSSSSGSRSSSSSGSWSFGSSSSSSGSSSSSSSDHSYRSRSRGSGRSRGGKVDPIVVLVAVGPLGLYGAVSFVRKTIRDHRSFDVRNHSGGTGPVVVRSLSWTSVDVTVLSLGIDWRARKLVQKRLEVMARSGKTGTPEGLVSLLRGVVACLADVELAWLYSGAFNAKPMSMEVAQSTFLRATQGARSRFKREIVRALDGTTVEEAAPAMRARAHEGEGVVVVTLVVAARRELRDLTNVRDAGQMREALRELARLGPGDLVAMEVIWSPSLEDDRMSSAELEALYPELKKISESSIAGRVFCAYCGGPHAAELPACPHCGSPTTAPAGAS